jgi:hypothetical protein
MLRPTRDDLSKPMAKTVHTMLRILDESLSTDFYQRAFGLGVADRFAFDDFTLVYLRGQESDFELESIMDARRRTRLATATAIWRSWSTISMPSTAGSARKACNPSRLRNSSVRAL